MKFRTYPLGNIELDIRVENKHHGVFVSAYGPNHLRPSRFGEFKAEVQVDNTGNALSDFNKAFEQLKEILQEDAKSIEVDTNSTKSKRSHYEAIRHACDYGQEQER